MLEFFTAPVGTHDPAPIDAFDIEFGASTGQIGRRDSDPFADAGKLGGVADRLDRVASAEPAAPTTGAGRIRLELVEVRVYRIFVFGQFDITR